jgi:hypothetical protein
VAEIYIAEEESPAGWIIHRSRAALLKAIHRLQHIPSMLDLVRLDRDSALILEPADMRTVRDSRRRSVLLAVFRQWHDAGRKLSVTTDPDTGERRGPLIYFVKAVVLCVTSPPATLQGETILKELKFLGRVVAALSPELVEQVHGLHRTRRDQDT